MTCPAMMIRAVRTRPDFATPPGRAGSKPSWTLNSPLGCSTDTMADPIPSTSAISWATVPLMTQAVAAVTAASTPIDSWQTCGIKRVLIVPPWAGGETSVILG